MTTRELSRKFVKARGFWLAFGALLLACGLGTVWYDRTSNAQVPDDPVGVGVVGLIGNERRCVGTVEQASQALGFSCPKDLCVARVLAQNCRSLPMGIIKTTVHGCSEHSSFEGIAFEISGARRKVCYYTHQGKRHEDPLVGVEAWDDQARFCGGTAVRISAGQTPTECIGPLDGTWCDLEHPEQSQPDDGELPRACLRAFVDSCEVCCPEVAPDCSNKPDGYPGYECVRPPPDNLWSCSCRAGRWDCL